MAPAAGLLATGAVSGALLEAWLRRGGLNSEVLLWGSVAVAVKKGELFGGNGPRKVNVAVPLAFVITFWKPRRKRPEGALTSLAKNSILNSVFGKLVRIPV